MKKCAVQMRQFNWQRKIRKGCNLDVIVGVWRKYFLSFTGRVLMSAAYKARFFMSLLSLCGETTQRIKDIH